MMREIKFKDFIKLQRGFDLPRKDMVEGTYPVVGSTSIIGWHNEYKKEPPGVITGRSGSLGVVQYIKEKYWPHNTSLWVKDFKGNHPRYVYYFLKTIPLSRFNSGAGVPTLNRNDLDTYEMRLHDYNIQIKIASILSAYDNLIENNNRRIEILEEMAQTIYNEWFVKFRLPGHIKVKMVDSELGKIPEGWHIDELEKYIKLDKGLSYKSKYLSETGIPIVSMGNVSPGIRFNYDKLKYYKGDYADKHKLNVGDLVVCTHDVTQHRKIIGSPAIVPKDIGNEIIMATNLFKVVPISWLDRHYLYYVFTSKDYRNRMIGHAKGTNVLYITPDAVLKYRLPIPQESIIHKFLDVIVPLDNEIEVLTQKNRILSKAHNLLLPKLISGKIDVENMDIDVGDVDDR